MDHFNEVIYALNTDHYGVIIACNMTANSLVKIHGLCAIVDSLQHVNGNGGGMITIASNPKTAVM